MVVVRSTDETEDLELLIQDFLGYECSSVLYTVCAWCGRYLGAKDGWGAPGVIEGICPNCESNESREPGAPDADKTAHWSYRVPCPGVKYYAFEEPFPR